MVHKAKVTDFTPDDHNANQGTVKGRRALQRSIQQDGLGRSILVDRNGKIIAGNKTQEVAVEAGLEDAIVVPTDGKTLVVVQRTDLDLDADPQARDLAYADNRVSEIDLSWNPAVVLADVQDGLDLSAHFSPDELRNLANAAVEMEVVDDGEYASGHSHRLALAKHKIVVGFGRFAGIVSAALAEQAVEGIKALYGDDPQAAFTALCSDLIERAGLPMPEAEGEA